LSQILRQASNRTLDLIEDLQRFSAKEQIEQIDIDKKGKPHTAPEQTVNYLAEVGQNSSGYPSIDEYRSGGTGVRQGLLVDNGTAAFALIFHPTHIGSFKFRCEGLTETQGLPAWQLRFDESDDPAKAFQSIRVGHAVYLPRFKGRAWIDTETSNVLRIETDLVSPIAGINLQLEHLVISYAPVAFEGHRVRLWLPESAVVYLAYRGHHFERIHNFSQFQLFSVDSDEAIKEPAVKKLAQVE
jgi:hypothetical protein